MGALLALVHNQGFSLFAPFDIVEKAGEKDKNRGTIQGIASSAAMDADGEVVHQDGLDWSFFLERGFLSLEHPLGIGNIIGAPIGVERKAVDGVDSTIIKAELYLDDPAGRRVYEKAKLLKSSGGKRKLGFSIEGRCLQRQGNEILKAKVHSVAISAMPKNPNSYFEPIMASLMAAAAANIGYQTPAMGGGNLAPLMPQSMQGVPSAGTVPPIKVRRSDDELTAELLKRYPWMSWTQGQAILKTVKKTMELD